MSSTLKKGRLLEEEQAREVCLKEAGESTSGYVAAKFLLEDLESLGFTFCPANSEIRKQDSRRRIRSLKKGFLKIFYHGPLR